MAPSSLSLLISLLALFSFSCESASPDPPPTALLFPISKNDTTLQYYTSLEMGTSHTTINAVIDLGGQFVWFDCDTYKSSSRRPISCRKPQCKVAPAWTCAECPVKECIKNTCGVYTYNPFMDSSLYALLEEDTMTDVTSTNGLAAGINYESPHFSFTCANNYLLDGLASDTNGLLGLGRTKTSLHAQLVSSFKLRHKFAICIPSIENGLGSIFIGGGPYYMPPLTKDMSKSFMTTPLVVNPVSNATVHRKGEASNEYFIDVKSIKIDGKVVSFPSSLLAIDKNGFGGTKIGTRTPYTVLQTPIYRPFVQAFLKAAEAMKIEKVKPVEPFGACFSARSIRKTKTGFVMPKIDLVLQGDNAVWRIYGSNSIVQTKKKDVVCLGFVEGGFRYGSTEQRTSIVLGAVQLENILLEFDLVASKLGFTSSLLHENTTCSQSRVF